MKLDLLRWRNTINFQDVNIQAAKGNGAVDISRCILKYLCAPTSVATLFPFQSFKSHPQTTVSVLSCAALQVKRENR